VAVFFDKVARLPRIVNIQDIVMKVDPSKKTNDLVTTCSAVTYKFLDIKEQPQTTDIKKGAPKKPTATKPGKHA
jgi:Tfp pilus assembly protein PilO